MRTNYLKTRYFSAPVILFLFVLPFVVFGADPIVQCSTPNECNFKELGEMFVRVIEFLLKIGLTLSAIGFAWAGVLYLTAGGDSGKISRAHEIFKKILIGFVLALSSFIIVDLIAGAFGLESFIRGLYNSFV